MSLGWDLLGVLAMTGPGPCPIVGHHTPPTGLTAGVLGVGRLASVRLSGLLTVKCLFESLSTQHSLQ